MGKNDYMARQRAMQQECLNVGEQMGIQKVWDYLQVVLHNPDVMGHDTFGPDRLAMIYTELKQMVDTYHTAFTDDVEADYYQEKLDAQLRAIWKDELVPFYQRYPALKQIKYDKARKGWV